MRRFFDRTLLFFICALVLIGVIIYNSIPNNKPANVKVAAIQKAPLLQYSYSKDAFSSVNKGDSLLIIGVDFREFAFLVQTPKGERGFVSQDAIESQGFLTRFNDIEGIKKETSVSVNRGDTVTFLGIDTKKDKYSPKMKFKTADGQQGWVALYDLVSLTANNLLKYHWDGGDYYLSKKKFEKLYVGKTFEEIEQLYRPAKFVKKDKNGLIAEYDLRIFDKKDGKFYFPAITFKDTVSTSFELQLASTNKMNAFILRYLPLVSTLLDVDFFSQLISKNTFERKDLYKEFNPVWQKIIGYILAVFLLICVLGFLFFLNHTLSFLLFGLLRFRFPLIFISNKLFPSLFLGVTVICTYVWIVLGLCYPCHWWYYIPIVIATTCWIVPKISEYFEEFPSNRCPHCKSMYTIEYDHENFEREYKEWRVKEDSQLLNSRESSEWVHDTEVTTWSDGHKSSRDVNQRKVTHTTKTYNNDVYDVLYLVKVYKITYICEHCGYEEYGSRAVDKILEKKYKHSYVDSSTTHSGY